MVCLTLEQAVELRMKIDDFAAQLAMIWDDLSPSAQAKALKLESPLSDIRRQIL